MRVTCKGSVFLLLLSCCFSRTFAQQQPGSAPQAGQPLLPSAVAADHRFALDVAVTDKSGKAVKGLEQKDFTVLDNGHPQNILSFKATGGGSETATAVAQPADPPVRIILLIDEVNTDFRRVASERDEIKRFLLQNGGTLTHPMSLAFFSDTGTEVQPSASRDGNGLLAMFDQHETALRTVRRSEGVYGALDRFQLSMKALQTLVEQEGRLPGRKVVVWISPGWPILSGPNINLDTKQTGQIFASIVSISTILREARMTIYSIDPLGVSDAGSINQTYFEEFLKPVTVARKTQIGDLALQVIATQTGGLTLRSSNDIAQQIDRCFADVDAYYTLMLETAPGDEVNTFHTLTVKVAQGGLTARTRNGYYSQQP
ncbi:MAG: VWA domain-containing protein [Edaphobacter sp.]